LRIKYFLPSAVILLSFLVLSCNGIFPTQTKSTVPSDHTIDRGGALHKEGYQQPLDECTECHGSDLKGGIYNNENGLQVACASCYQCHSSVWERTGGGGGNVLKFFKQNSK
jgi:hypothetical protein